MRFRWLFFCCDFTDSTKKHNCCHGYNSYAIQILAVNVMLTCNHVHVPPEIIALKIAKQLNSTSCNSHHKRSSYFPHTPCSHSIVIHCSRSPPAKLGQNFVNPIRIPFGAFCFAVCIHKSRDVLEH